MLGIVFNLIRDIGSVTEVLTVLQDVPEEGRARPSNDEAWGLLTQQAASEVQSIAGAAIWG